MPARAPTVLGLVFGLGVTTLAAGAAALPFNFEMRQLHPEINAAARYVYGACTACTLAQYQAIVTPSGWEKAPPRVGLWSSGTFTSPTPPAGAPSAVDFVPEIPGDEFLFIAEVLSAQIVGYDASLGILATAQVRRDTVHTYDAGSVVHEVIDAAGNHYVLLTFDYALSQSTYDLGTVGSLASLALPVGWSYESRILTQPLVIASNGLATVFSQGNVATYQEYSVPEPAGVGLVGLVVAIVLGGGTRRWA